MSRHAGAVTPWAAAALAVAGLVASGAAPADDLGRHERIAVYGASLDGNLSGDDPSRPVSVYLPPGYDENPERRFPVLYLLHGYTNTADGWFGITEHYVNVRAAADAAWRNGAAELIIVMPDAYTRFAGSMYSSSVTTGDWQAYVAEELVAQIDANYRTIPERASRGLTGHSMGGYGALRIGMRYPGVFGALYAMSPCCLAPELEPSHEAMARAAAITSDEQLAGIEFGIGALLASAAAWSPNPERPPFYLDLPIENGEMRPEVIAKWVANAPLTTVHQYIPQLRTFTTPIHLDAGDEDEPIAGTVRSLAGVLESYGIDHVSEIYEGGHRDRVHERVETRLLPVMGDLLEQ